MKLWIARDPDNKLWMFDTKPTYYPGVKGFGCNYGEHYAELWDDWFPEITFENSPMEVELVIKR